MATTISGTVQSGGTEGALPLADARVALLETGGGTHRAIGIATTDAAGRFSIANVEAATDGIVYARVIVGDGVALVTVMGTETIPASITVNELTTVAAAFSMAQFTEAGAIQGDPAALRVAAGMNENLVSPVTGQSSDVLLSPPNADQTNSLRSTRALANLLAPCVVGRPGAWDTVRALTTPPGGDPPTDTFQALVNIALNPAHNVDEIYAQTQVMEPYRPPLDSAPDAWTLAVKVNRTGGTGERSMFGGPANISFDRNGYAWVANNVFQGTPNSADFVVVLKPNGMPADGQNGTPVSPVVGGGLMGPGFGIDVDRLGNVWAGSYGWGKDDYVPKKGIVSKFDATGSSGTAYTERTKRVQGVVADSRLNVWLASYDTDSVVVYPEGRAADAFHYPDHDKGESAPGSCTFGIAIDERDETDPVTWVTYGGGLGWPKANPAHVARFRIENGALQCTLKRQVGAASKGIAVDSHGNAWIASGGDDTVYMVTPDDVVTAYRDRGGIDGPWGVSVDGNDDIWVANFGALGIPEDYTNAGVSKLAGVGSPSGLPVGTAISPATGYTLPTAGEPVTLPGGAPLYEDGTVCKSPLMRMTSVTIDVAGNLWAVNNWKPRFRTDFPPGQGNPGGDGIVIFVGIARPPKTVS